MDKKTLRQRRFKVFVNQFGDAENQRHGWKSELARRIKKTPSAVSQYAAGTLKAETDTIQVAIEAFGIDPTFFSDPSLGESPNYRDFIGKKPARVAGVAESRIERDPIDESSMDQWSVFKHTNEYKNASEEAKAQAHALRNQGLDLSVKQYIGVVESLDALRKGRGIPEHKIETPIGETRMRLGKKGR
ncbi:MAG: helix-turn-helix transcriptional regulator [Sandaracinaceae bacterium]|nr:helix-turn-helix transcriptional regulator [Sandaracinaceae bacterium]